MAKWQWSQTFAANATADPNINWAEGMSPSSVNDSARAMMGVDAQDLADSNGTVTATGTGTAYVVSSNQGFGSSPQVGMRLSFCPNVVSGSPATIQVDSIPTKPLRPSPGVELSNGALQAGVPYRITYFSSNGGEWIVNGVVNISSGSGTGPFINILNNNGNNNGVVDNSAAIVAAVNTANAIGGRVYFPAGTYFVAIPVAIPLPASGAPFHLSFYGDGNDASVLTFAAGAGITINYRNSAQAINNQSFSAEDLTFAAGGSNSGSGLTLIQSGSNNGSFAAWSRIVNCAFRGADGRAGTKSWAFGVNCSGISNIIFDGCEFIGPATVGGGGINYAGLNASNVAVVCVVDKCNFNLHTIGFDIGDNAQGVFFTNCNWVDCRSCINYPAGLSGIDAQLCVDNCQFGMNSPPGGNAITVGTALNVVEITNSLFLLGSNTGGIDLAQASNTTITDNSFLTGGSSTTVTGLAIIGMATGAAAAVTDNLFSGFQASGAQAITIGSGASNILLDDNAFIGCSSTPIINASGGSLLNYHWNNVSGGFSQILINGHGNSGDHGIVIAAGANGATDSATTLVGLSSGNNSVQVGSITRSGSGVAFNITSDRRRKRDIAPTIFGLAELRRIPIVDFAFIDDPARERRQGIISQDLYRHIPWAVRKGGRNVNKQPWLLDPGALVPLCMRSTQELADMIDDQAETIKQLSARLAKLERKRAK